MTTTTDTAAGLAQPSSAPTAARVARRTGAAAGRTRRLAALRPAAWLPILVMLAVVGLLWTWGAASMPYLLAPLGEIASTLTGNPLYYLENAWITLQEALIGMLIGFVVAVVLAILMSEVAVIRRAVMPIAVVLNVTPLIAIAPALVVAFGFGPEPKLIVTALMVFFPILINVSSGLRSVHPAVLQFYSVIKASRLEMLWHVRIPTSLPYMFAALKIVFPLSVIGAVVAEMSAPGAAEGLGTVISLASSNAKLAVVYASILVLALMGSLLLGVVTVVERYALRWHESAARGNG